MKRWPVWLPLIAFLGVLLVVAWGIYRPADRTVRSALIGQPLPPFELAAMVPGKPATSSRPTGRPRIVNVFASWCVPCVAEAPHLLRLKAAGVTIDAVAIRDTPQAVAGFLRRNGDPYAAIGSDPESRVQLALGSSGVPESFVIDRRGRIVKQHIGDIRAEDVPDLLAALGDAR